MVGWRARRTSRADAAELFSRERNAILRLARSVDVATGSRCVLIKRLRGLEDSSRFWSAYMVLDHLRIVNENTTELIGQLVRSDKPTKIVSTADVKPSPSVDAKVIDKFSAVCDRFEQNIAAISNLQTELRWPHPWFGPLDAAKWHFFTGFHMSLHHRQMKTILRAAEQHSTINFRA